MNDLTHYPVLVFVFSFLVLWLAAWIGWSVDEKETGLGRGIA